jgi:hypothetical protein
MRFMKLAHILVWFGAVVALGCSGKSASSSPDGGGASQAGGGAGGLAGSGAGGGAGAGSGGADAGQGGASGGGAGAAGGGETMSELAACHIYLDALCARTSRCQGLTNAAATCGNLLAQCPDILFSPGSTRTIASVLEGATSYADAPCGAANHGTADPTVTPGTRQVGEPCLFPNQCESLFCTGLQHSMTCGECVAPLASGAACELGTSGQFCPLDETCLDGRCSPIPSMEPVPLPAGPNESCLGTGRCVEGYHCVTEGDARYCRPLPGPGEACALGMTCNADAYCDEEGTCQRLPGVGQPCGVVRSFRVCDRGAWCDRNMNDTCAAPRPLGASCIPSNCGPEAACVGAAGENVCRRVRREGQSCSEPHDHCSAGTACMAGTCQATGLQGLFEAACGG